jgi:hypothetical protein
MIGQTLQVEVACASLEVEVQQLKLYENQLRASLGVNNGEQVAENENDQIED